MNTVLPKVTIALAVYKPETEWFVEQLKSLNKQNYIGPMELLVWNDSPDSFRCEPYLEKYITNMPYRVLSDGKNHGATKAFEELTKAADGAYISYCDQDDVWDKAKIEKSVAFLQDNRELAACHCNLKSIDSKGEIISNSLISDAMISKWNDRKWQFRKILVHNQSCGCALLMRTEKAKQAIPFSKYTYHDHWLFIYAVQNGGLQYLPKILMYHREHGDNASARLAGIRTKEDYYKKKTIREYNLLHDIELRFGACADLIRPMAWVNARREYQQKKSFRSFFKLLSAASVRYTVSLFELLMPAVPESAFERLIKFVR